MCAAATVSHIYVSPCQTKDENFECETYVIMTDSTLTAHIPWLGMHK